MCLLSCQQKQTFPEMRHKNVNWFGLCTFNQKKKKKKTNPKTWLLKGPKCLFIMISNTEQGTAESLLLFTLKTKFYKFPKLLRKKSKQ